MCVCVPGSQAAIHVFIHVMSFHEGMFACIPGG